MILVPLFNLKFLNAGSRVVLELQIGGTGHQAAGAIAGGVAARYVSLTGCSLEGG